MLYFWENNNNMARSIRLLQHRRIVIRVHTKQITHWQKKSGKQTPNCLLINFFWFTYQCLYLLFPPNDVHMFLGHALESKRNSGNESVNGKKIYVLKKRDMY